MVSEGFSISFRQPPRQEPLQELWAVDEHRLFVAGERMCVLRTTRDPVRAALVGRAFGSSLTHCRRFATLDEHAARLASVLGAQDQGYIRRALKALCDQGLMVNHRQLFERQHFSAPPTSEPPAATFIRSRHRVPELERLLGECWEKYGPRRPFVVVDDSEDVVATEGNRAVCDAMAARGLNVRLSGRMAWEESCAGEDLGAERELVHWLLLGGPNSGGGSYGAALNRVLLLSAGRRAFLLDDDAHLAAYSAQAMDKPAAITMSGQPYRDRFLPPDALLSDGFEPLTIDPLAEHEALLGHTIGSCLKPRESQWRELARGLDPVTLDRLDDQSSVRLTVNGVLGDSGAPSNLRLFLADPESLGRAAHSDDQFRKLARNHSVWRGRDATNLSSVNVLTATTLVGIDNHSIVPPVLPEGRGEDYLFSAVLEFLYPGAFIAELPWALLHAPERQRIYDRGLFEKPFVPSSTQILAEGIRSQARYCRARDPGRRLEDLSETIEGWARLHETEFRQLWEEIVVTARAALLGQLEKSQRRHAQSAASVRADVQRLIELNGNFGRETLASHDLGHVRSVWGRYSQALKIWPSLWSRHHDSGQ